MAITTSTVSGTSSVFTIAGGIAALLLSYILIGSIVNYWKLKQFNGPPLAAFSKFWIFWEDANARLPHSTGAALEKYGSPARIGPSLLVTNDQDLIRHMNAPGSQWTRSTWYNAMKLDPRQDSVFSTRNEKFHAEMKAKESPGYNGRDTPDLEGDIDACILELLNLIKTTYNGVSMDAASVSRFFTLDVLSKIAFGKSFGFMAGNEDKWSFNKAAADFMFILGMQTNHFSVYRFLSQGWVQALVAPKVTDKLGWGPALAFARDAVSERHGPDAKVKKDMLGSFIERGLDQKQCECEAFLQIMAGSDSTTDVLRSTIFLLSGNPPAYAKLRAEIDNAVAQGLSSGATDSVIKYTDVITLPYLKACVWEALRISPPLFGLKTKCAPKGGETVKGIFYPEGTEVGIDDHSFMRRREIFGEDVDTYRPDRYLEGDEELQKMRVRNTEVVFGSGRFLCLGKHIATMELHKVVFELFRTFDFQIADPTKGIKLIHHSVHQASEMNVVARPRQ